MLIIELEFIFIEILKLVKFFKLFIVWIYFYESLDMTSKMFLRWLESLISKIWSFFLKLRLNLYETKSQSIFSHHDAIFSIVYF